VIGIARGDEVIVITWLIGRIVTCPKCTRVATPRSRSPECWPPGLPTDRTRWAYIA
jgi:hypothetical protein